MASAEILTIGTELLLGEIVDTNSSHIARTLRDHGMDIFWITTVGDNPERIAQALKLGLERSDVVITTGGLGPTVDDPTREATALALGVETEFRPELWQQVQDRFARFGRTPTDNNRRQAYVPQGAIAIENPVGTAPAFIVETESSAIICLPGVPREMEHLLQHAVIPYLKERLDLQGLIKARVLHTAGMGESAIDQKIADLETLSNPTVGLAAHAGSVDVRITAKAASEEEADALIAPVETDLRKRLADWIYGADGDTLEHVALAHIDQLGWSLAVVEAGLDGQLTQRIAQTNHPAFLGGEILGDPAKPDILLESCQQFKIAHGADLCFGVSLACGEVKQTLHLSILSPVKSTSLTRTYGGPPRMAAQWGVNLALDLIRKLGNDA
jgi:nicotinamide-nucleotide amidase